MIQGHIRQEAIELGCRALVVGSSLGTLAVRGLSPRTNGNMVLSEVYVQTPGVSEWHSNRLVWLSGKAEVSPPYTTFYVGYGNESDPALTTDEEE